MRCDPRGICSVTGKMTSPRGAGGRSPSCRKRKTKVVVKFYARRSAPGLTLHLHNRVRLTLFSSSNALKRTSEAREACSRGVQGTARGSLSTPGQRRLHRHRLSPGQQLPFSLSRKHRRSPWECCSFSGHSFKTRGHVLPWPWLQSPVIPKSGWESRLRPIPLNPAGSQRSLPPASSFT